MSTRITGSLAVLLCLLGGCATHYTTPAAGVSLDAIDDADIRSHYERQPASPFPANIAFIRVQDAGYATRTAHGYGNGRYSVVTTRDVEPDSALASLAALPMVGDVAPLGRLLLPTELTSIRDLRVPAARLHADLVLIYSIDTSFAVEGKALGPLSLISLGLLPNKKANVTATVAGALVDVRSGYIYGTTEATVVETQRSSVWSTEMAIDTARLTAEKAAFADFVAEFGALWSGVVNTYAATAPPVIEFPVSQDTWHELRFNN